MLSTLLDATESCTILIYGKILIKNHYKQLQRDEMNKKFYHFLWKCVCVLGCPDSPTKPKNGIKMDICVEDQKLQ